MIAVEIEMTMNEKNGEQSRKIVTMDGDDSHGGCDGVISTILC